MQARDPCIEPPVGSAPELKLCSDFSYSLFAVLVAVTLTVWLFSAEQLPKEEPKQKVRR